MKKKSLIFWALFYLAIFLLSLIPHLFAVVNQSDKFLHVTAYCFLMMGPVFIFENRRKKNIIAIFLILTGFALEYLQGVIGGREVSLYDGLANMAGVIIGYGVASLMLSGLQAHPQTTRSKSE